MNDFHQILDKLNVDFEKAVQNGKGEDFSRLSTIFENIGAYFREYIQDETGREIKAVLRKLRDGSELADEDMELLRIWMVGDALHYVKLENNFDDWVDELKRLVGVILSYKDKAADIHSACELRGLLRDGSRVLADIFYYVQQKDRIERFEEASRMLGPQERTLLVRLLEQKIQSKDF